MVTKESSQKLLVIQVVSLPKGDLLACQIWKFIPVKIDPKFASSQPSSEGAGSEAPPYDVDENGQSSARTQRTELERDELGTIVNEVTVVTAVTRSTVTTQKRYRAEDT